MADTIILGLVAVIAGMAVGYVYKSVKAGKTCIGCPENGKCTSRSCSGKCPSKK